jgi:hypothetical protein
VKSVFEKLLLGCFVFFLMPNCLCVVEISNGETLKSFSEKFFRTSKVKVCFTLRGDDPESELWEDKNTHNVSIKNFKELCKNFNTEAEKSAHKLPKVLAGVKNSSYFQKIMVPESSKVCFIGDIHGDAPAFLVILLDLASKGHLYNNFKIKEKDFYIVFTGDYADRGAYGTEVYYLMLRLKLANWDKVMLIRGNHEIDDIAEKYGFWSELNNRYKAGDINIKNEIKKLWNYMPAVVFLGCNASAFVRCCHGGLNHSGSPTKDFLTSKDEFSKAFDLDKYPGFLWSDFGPIEKSSGFEDSARGIGWVTNKVVTKKYLSGVVKVIFRGHQHVGSCVKLFSSSGDERRDDLVGWREEFSPISLEEKRTCELSVKDCGPVVTFTTASVLGETSIGYGILSLAHEFRDWKLKVIEWGDNMFMSSISLVEDKIYPEYANYLDMRRAVVRFDIPEQNILTQSIELLKNKLLELAKKLTARR